LVEENGRAERKIVRIASGLHLQTWGPVTNLGNINIVYMSGVGKRKKGGGGEFRKKTSVIAAVKEDLRTGPVRNGEGAGENRFVRMKQMGRLEREGGGSSSDNTVRRKRRLS